MCVVVAVGKLRVNELCAGQELSRIEKKKIFNLLHVKNYLNGVDYNTIVGKLYPIRGVGVRPKAEKKIVSVGVISTFRHPLGREGETCVYLL